MKTFTNSRAFAAGLLTIGLLRPAAAAQNADVEQLVKQLLSEAKTVEHTDAQLEAAYSRVIETLISAEAFPGIEGSPKHSLEEIIMRAGAPGAEKRRVALVRAMLAYLDRTGDLNEQVFLLRQLGAVGREESVPPLAGLLKDEAPAVRQYALRALQMNSSSAAGKALADSLAGAEQPRWQVALINALGARREASAAGAVSRMLAGPDEDVAEAAAMALGNIASPEAAKALAAARAGPSDKVARFVTRASLLCANRLLENGERALAAEIYQDVYDRASPPLFRMAALRGLAITKGAVAAPLVIRALKSDHVRTQAQAARLVLEIPGPEATKAFLEAMPNLAPSAQAFLLEALAEREDGEGETKR
jgi:HEAT repeat protein